MVKHVNPDGGWKVLIIDEESTKIISAALSMYDIMDENVSCTCVPLRLSPMSYRMDRADPMDRPIDCTVVEGLEKKRRKMPKSDALYFLTPTEASIDLLNEDWKDRSEPQYRAIHLFFSTRTLLAVLARVGRADVDEPLTHVR